MIDSFVAKGFKQPDCEFLYLNNCELNRYDSYRGYNLFLNVATGKYIILCHQDIILLDDGRSTLDRLLFELTETDPTWALCGNAGGVETNNIAVRISDLHGDNQSRGTFPVQATSLDENFIVVRREANIALSRDLEGFHFYGADMCIIANVLGWTAYVIDFHLRHNGTGNLDPTFFSIREGTIAKWRRAFRSRWITTTCSELYISGLPLAAKLLSSDAGRRFETRVNRFRTLWRRRSGR
jgi:hypothetical protein